MMNYLLNDSTLELFNKKYEKSDEYNVLLAFDATIIACNEKFQQMTGYSKEELIGISCFDLIIPKELQKAENAFQNLSDNRKLDLVEFNVRKKNGSSELSYWVSEEFFDENLKSIAFLSTGTSKN